MLEDSHAAPTADPTSTAPGIRVDPPGKQGFLSRSVTARWPVIAACAVLGLIAAAAVSLLDRDERHIARVQIAVVPLPGSDAGSLRPSLAHTLAGTPRLAAEAADSLKGQGIDSRAVTDAVEVLSDDSGVLEVQATAGDADRATAIATAFAIAYRQDLRRFERRRLLLAAAAVEAEAGLLPDPDGATGAALAERAGALRAAAATSRQEIKSLADAEVSDRAETSLVRNLGIGLGGGLLVGFLLALALEGIDKRLRRPEDLEEIYGLPVVARIPRSKLLASGTSVTTGAELAAVSGFSREAEGFRTLRANLRYFGSGGGIGSLLVVSPLSGEGKSTITRLLAVTMAAMGDSVCLVDADLRKGDLSAPTPEAREEGLSLVLAGFDLDSALYETPAATDPISSRSRVLVELGSGPLPPNPSELLEGERMRWVISELEDRFDTVLIDSPAIASVADALGLVRLVSGVLVVSALGKTTRSSAIAIRKQLAVLGARQVGVVANHWQPAREYSYPYGTPVEYRSAAK